VYIERGSSGSSRGRRADDDRVILYTVGHGSGVHWPSADRWGHGPTHPSVNLYL